MNRLVILLVVAMAFQAITANDAGYAPLTLEELAAKGEAADQPEPVVRIENVAKFLKMLRQIPFSIPTEIPTGPSESTASAGPSSETSSTTDAPETTASSDAPETTSSAPETTSAQ